MKEKVCLVPTVTFLDLLYHKSILNLSGTKERACLQGVTIFRFTVSHERPKSFENKREDMFGLQGGSFAINGRLICTESRLCNRGY